MGELLELAPSVEKPGLPPREVWLPLTEKIETPVDDLGRVNRFQLVELVRATVDPEFSWPLDEGNAHHLYWPRAAYPCDQRRGDLHDPTVFRNRCNHMIRLPIMFHNWVHQVTVPPPLPSLEVRVHMTEASIAAEKTLIALTKAIKHERESRRILRKMAKMTERERFIYLHRGKRPTSERGRLEVAEKSEIDFQLALEQMRQLPKEFQLVNPNLSRMSLRRELGRVVGIKPTKGAAKGFAALPMLSEVYRKIATAPAASSAQISHVA